MHVLPTPQAAVRRSAPPRARPAPHLGLGGSPARRGATPPSVSALSREPRPCRANTMGSLSGGFRRCSAAKKG